VTVSVRSLEAAGYMLGDDLVNDQAREHFRNGLFSAFGQAQSVVRDGWHLVCI